MAIDIKFNTTALEGARKWSDSEKNRIKKTVIPRRDGALIDDYPVLDSRAISVSGIIAKDTVAALRTSLDTLEAVLNSGKQKLYLHDDRYIECVKSSFKADYVKGFVGKAIKYSIKFVAEDPYWYSTSSTSATNSSAVTADTETTLDVVSSTGNATVDCVITAVPDTVTMTSLKIYNSHTNIDKYWLYEGSVDTGGLVTIDSGNRTVVLDSKNDLANFSGDFWNLQCGATNTLSILSNQDIAIGDLDITWTPRWY